MFIFNKKVQLIAILATIFVVWFVYLPQSTTNLVKEIVSNCAFQPPGNWRPGPYPSAIPWCETYKKQRYNDLIDHLKFSSLSLQDHTILTAPEFGSDVRVLYIPGRDLVMLNPEVEFHNGEMGVCLDDLGNGPIQTLRPKQTTVRFINSQYRLDSTTLDGDLACLVQAAIESFVGLQPVYVTIVN